jgi:acylphosphatase
MDMRKHVYYYGAVQGVGFRATAFRAAQGLPVTGFVRNLRDGRVELVAEGGAAEVERLLAQIGRAMAGCIRRTDVLDERPTGEFDRFSVAFAR